MLIWQARWQSGLIWQVRRYVVLKTTICLCVGVLVGLIFNLLQVLMNVMHVLKKPNTFNVLQAYDSSCCACDLLTGPCVPTLDWCAPSPAITCNTTHLAGARRRDDAA